MHELVLLIGLDATFIMLKHFAGTRVEITQCRTTGSKSKGKELENLIGQDAASKLRDAYYAQRKVTIPKCSAAMKYLRNVEMRQKFDELTMSKDKHITASSAVSILADEYDLVESTIWAILKSGE